jgi:hypothetical protein
MMKCNELERTWEEAVLSKFRLGYTNPRKFKFVR